MSKRDNSKVASAVEYPGVVVGVAVVLLNKFWSLWNFVSGLMSDPWIDETERDWQTPMFESSARTRKCRR